MPRYPIREARELLDKVLVAAPGSAGGWRPTWSAWSIESGSRSASTRRQSPGNCCPGRAEPSSDGWTSSPGPQDLLKRVQNHRIDLADALARRAELGRELDDPPSEVRGLIERHEQLRAEGRGSGGDAEDFYPRTCRAAWPPTWSGARRGPVGAACGDRTQLGRG